MFASLFRPIGSAIAMAALAVAVTATGASASTTLVGPLGTYIQSGNTTCFIHQNSWDRMIQKHVVPESPVIQPTLGSTPFAKARWTIHLYSSTDGVNYRFEQTYTAMGHWDGVVAPAYSFMGQMPWIPINAAFRGRIAVHEAIELMDANGQVLRNGTYQGWEDEYRTYISTYSPSFEESHFGICAF